jgi:arginyl-tRNA synthetase
MSSRKGNFLKAVDVLNEVNAALEREHESVDEKVSLGATKYAFLKYKVGGNIIFEPEESVKMTGNSGPYLQYSAVRASKIIGNLLQNGVKSNGENWELTERERELIKKIIAYPEELKSIISELAPNKLCTYLYELAQEFSRFYETTKVAGSEFEFERGQIVLAYLKILTHGLGLLGIEVPERM